LLLELLQTEQSLPGVFGIELLLRVEFVVLVDVCDPLLAYSYMMGLLKNLSVHHKPIGLVLVVDLAGCDQILFLARRLLRAIYLLLGDDEPVFGGAIILWYLKAASFLAWLLGEVVVCHIPSYIFVG
jgi:hypothetical protein